MAKLAWTQVDRKRRCPGIHAEQSISGKAIAVPFNDEAVSIIQQQLGLNPEWELTYLGKPVLRANNHAWRKALIWLELKNCRCCDLRHTWVNWYVQQRTPLIFYRSLGAGAALKW
ncbi:MAG: hypothetical protein K0U68_06395 [Gammaproteobacteria bacterium]|nr:hypothetical protein [Gammaproteobacteria bacterium]